MGQVALGFRSLLLRALVFFIMAVLLAWALGGTLWPAPVSADLRLVAFQGKTWAWQARLDPSPESGPPLRYQLVWGSYEEPRNPFDPTLGSWTETLPLKIVDDRMVVAGHSNKSGKWLILQISPGGSIESRETFADRFQFLAHWMTLVKS